MQNYVPMNPEIYQQTMVVSLERSKILKDLNYGQTVRGNKPILGWYTPTMQLLPLTMDTPGLEPLIPALNSDELGRLLPSAIRNRKTGEIFYFYTYKTELLWGTGYKKISPSDIYLKGKDSNGDRMVALFEDQCEVEARVMVLIFLLENNYLNRETGEGICS